MENSSLWDESAAAINRRNAMDILLQQSYDAQEHRFDYYQYEIDQDGDINMRDQLLKITDYNL